MNFYKKSLVTVVTLCEVVILDINDFWLSVFFTVESLSLHAGGSEFRLYDGSDLKTYLLIRW